MNWKRILTYGLILAAALLVGINYNFFARELNNIGIGVLFVTHPNTRITIYRIAV